MDGLIFDVDGTLWDSTDVVAISWNKTIEKYTDEPRRITGADLKKEFGKPMDDIMNSLYPSIVGKERQRISNILFVVENEDVKEASCILYPGLKETIQKLSKKHKLFIVSNCQAGYIDAFLENTGLGEYFADDACPGDTGKLKADNIRIVMERNGLDSAVYIGDTQGDADACKEAGVPMIYARYGFGKIHNEQDYTGINSFPELLELDYNSISFTTL